MNSAILNMVGRYLFDFLCLSLLDIHLVVGVVFHSGCTDLYSRQLCVSVCLCPFPYQQLFIPLCVLDFNHADHSGVVLIGISLMDSDG